MLDAGIGPVGPDRLRDRAARAHRHPGHAGTALGTLGHPVAAGPDDVAAQTRGDLGAEGDQDLPRDVADARTQLAAGTSLGTDPGRGSGAGHARARRLEGAAREGDGRGKDRQRGQGATPGPAGAPLQRILLPGRAGPSPSGEGSGTEYRYSGCTRRIPGTAPARSRTASGPGSRSRRIR